MRWRQLGVLAVMGVMAVGCVIGLLFFARPSISELEKRTLTPFPSITGESFLDGSFFTDVSLWYSDTYPLRDSLVSLDRALSSFGGVAASEGLISGNVQADEVPVAVEQDEDVPLITKPEEEVEAPDERAVAEAVQNSIMDGLYIKDGKAYAMCYFVQSGADTYIASINTATERLSSTSRVFSIVVPSSAITLSDEEESEVGGSSQRQVLDYVWTRLDDRATHVDLVDVMKEHRDEYIYFYTDHHWTQRGAYLGYVQYCKARGIEPNPLDSYKYLSNGDFTGTYYESIQSIMTPTVDELETWTPNGTNDMTWWTSDGIEDWAPVVNNATDWALDGKYGTFINSEQAREVIENPSIDDGSSCLVVKDSYGNALVPFLVDNYQTVHILDPRYYYGDVCDYAIENDIQDVLFIYSIKVGLTDKYGGLLYMSVSSGVK